jgi:hypothetical protein
MKIIVMVYNYFSHYFHLNILLISDYYAAAARGRPPSASGTPSYEMQGRIHSIKKNNESFFSFCSWW